MTVLLTMGVCLSSQSALADSFNWQSVNGQNWNTTVKSQFGGTCWDFSACGTLEAKYMLTRNDPSFDPDVSEEEICWETMTWAARAAAGVLRSWTISPPMASFRRPNVLISRPAPTSASPPIGR